MPAGFSSRYASRQTEKVTESSRQEEGVLTFGRVFSYRRGVGLRTELAQILIINGQGYIIVMSKVMKFRFTKHCNVKILLEYALP